MGWLNKEEFEKTLDFLTYILDNYKIKCLCDNIFESEDLNHSYDVNDKTYWIYTSCPICKYDYNYNKIIRQYESIKEKV